MIEGNPIFAKNKDSIIDTVEILKNYERNIRSIVTKRPELFENALSEVNGRNPCFLYYFLR